MWSQNYKKKVKEQEKCAIQQLDKCLKQAPNDNKLREKVLFIKKKYQSTLKKKKNDYKFSIIYKMKETINKAPQKFWKLLEKIAPNSSKSISPNNIKM